MEDSAGMLYGVLWIVLVGGGLVMLAVDLRARWKRRKERK